ncbi:MAG: aminotransferase class I/II-fold pyridoxal phosphate-dependent enzyme [Alphaproteobacteria bacterium]
MSDTPNYDTLLNAPTKSMRPSPTFAVAAAAKARKDKGDVVYDFSVGQPAEATPEYVRTALKKMLDDDKLWKLMSVYSPVPGLPQLKKAVVEKFTDENAIDYNFDKEKNPFDVMITNGGKQAIANAFAVTIQSGDQVLMAEPSWVSYPDMVERHGGESIGIRTNKEFKFTAEALKATLAEAPHAKWLVITSPSNPTGGTYTKQELFDISEVVLAENKKRQTKGRPPLMVLSDDIYEHMVYDDAYLNKPNDPAAISNNIIMANPEMKPYTVIVNGVAKAFAMTGHRVGYAAGPKKIIDAMANYQGLETSGVSAMEQLAAMAALSREHKAARDAWFSAQKASYLKRRDLVAQLVNNGDSTMSFAPTPGAFYAMIECTQLADKTGGCKKLADKMINQKGVALVAGDDFYITPDEGKIYLRMSYATDEATIREGIVAMQALEKEILPDGMQRVAARS